MSFADDYTQKLLKELIDINKKILDENKKLRDFFIRQTGTLEAVVIQIGRELQDVNRKLSHIYNDVITQIPTDIQKGEKSG